MEVKDLLKDQIDEKEQKAIELKERKENYKKTQKYIVSEDFDKLCGKLTESADKMLKDIIEEIQNREECKSKFSEVDKILADIAFYNAVKKELGDSEGEEVLKKEFDIRIANAESHVYIKVSVEEMFDFATYTQLDMLKMKRNRFATIREYITKLSEGFFDTKEVEKEDNPYKEV